MTPAFVTPGQIAEVAGLSDSYVRRIVSRFLVDEPDVSPTWHGKRLRVSIMECGPEIEFSSLPDHIREAFVMCDQEELPLLPPPAVNILILNELLPPIFH